MTIHLQPVVRVLAAVLSIITPAFSADKGTNANHAKSGPSDAEKQAIIAIDRLGGWVKRDKDGHVVEVNMVYHYTKDKKRLENRNESAEALKVVPQFPRLKLLALKGGQATDHGLKHVRGLKHLEKVFMWDAQKLTDAGIAHLKTLKKLSYLHVNIEYHKRGTGVGLTDKSLESLGTIKTLNGLALQGHHFTDKGLEHASKLTNLTSFWVGQGKGKITDRGMRFLRKLKRLKTLDLQDTAITDEGLEELTTLKGLEQLCVLHTKVTKEGVEELKRAIPKLKLLGGKYQFQ